FSFNATSTAHIHTLSLHDALPIYITLNATGGGFLTASKQFRHGATSKSRSNTASNSTKHKSPHLSKGPKPLQLKLTTYIPKTSADRKSGSAGMPRPISYAVFCLKK